MRRNILLFIALLFLGVGVVHADPVPFFRNFSPSDYNSLSQNWSLAQDSRGYVYVGNNSCLLRFNGYSWEKFRPFGGKSDAIVRSIYYDREYDRLYVGTFKEFGYIEYDEYGCMQYTSLFEKSGIKAGDNDEIWYITREGNHIFFIYFTCYYEYDLDSGMIKRTDAGTSYFYSLNGNLYMAPQNGPIRRHSGYSLSYEIVPEENEPEDLLKVFDGPDSTYVAVSAREGLFALKNGESVRMDTLGDAWGVANRAIRCKDGDIVVGFISSGVYAFSPDGKLLWHINSENGLIDNTVLALMEDSCGNIWCALDKGLAVIYRGRDSMISLSDSNMGKPTASLLCGDELFVGSNQGLAVFSLDSERMILNRKSTYFPDQQIWSLYEKDGCVFIGENGNSYIFEGDKVSRISNAPGGVVPCPLTLRDGSDVLLQGSFTMLYLYENRDGEWRFRNTVRGFMRPAKKIEVDYLGNIWVEHMYRDIYKVVLSEDGTEVESETVYPLDGGKICKMAGRMLLHSADGFFCYDDSNAEFKPFDLLNEALGSYRNCDRVICAGGDRYWLVKDNSAVLIKFHGDEVRILDKVDCNDFGVNMTERFESILSLPGDRYLFSVEDAFLLHEITKDGDDTLYAGSPSMMVSGISSYHNGSMHRLSLEDGKYTLPNSSSIQISLAVNGTRYHDLHAWYELESFDYEPHPLGRSMTASYQRLPRGNYVFHAWVDDGIGHAVAEISFPVVVKPSFFASWPALLIYLLLAGLLTLLTVNYVRAVLKKQYRRLEAEKEKEIITLRNEQLEESVLLKSKELATYSLMESRRNQVLQKLRDELGRMRSEKSGLSRADYDLLLSIIKEGEFSENNWDKFYTNFDLIHQSFFRNLRQRHPDLTSNDLRICAYLRLNMSTKELADVMGITLKGAEAAKYRLRKKLGVDSATPLHEYLSDIIQA